MSKIVINPLDLRSCYSGIVKPFSIFNELCLDDQNSTFYNKGDQSHANFAQRRMITICVSLTRKEICIQMSLQLLSSSADCSSVLQLDPAKLFRLYLLLNSGHLDSAVSCICSIAQIQAFSPKQRQHESFSFFTLNLQLLFNFICSLRTKEGCKTTNTMHSLRSVYILREGRYAIQPGFETVS